MYEKKGFSPQIDSTGIELRKRLKVNYDLFNNKVDISEFNHVCKPFGDEVGELPIKFKNKDITSPKIKAVLNMEASRPFMWSAIATNPEATTRKEQEEFKRMREYVVNSIIAPIKQEIALKKEQENLGRELTPDEQQKIIQEIEEETQAATPEEVKRYMLREHQDPAEVMANQTLRYFSKKLDVQRKFDKAFKHAALSAMSIMYLGVFEGDVQVWNVNSMDFACDVDYENDFIEDGEWATCRYYFSPSKIASLFKGELTPRNLDDIYEAWRSHTYYDDEDLFLRAELSIDNRKKRGIPVVHSVWKALRKIGFLTYIDERGVEREKIVDEDYELKKDFGDIKVEWEWIPEVYEGWKILLAEPIYVSMRPLPGQFKDINNIYKSKLPYYGYTVDSLNSDPTGIMDRLIDYQYAYNIICYKIDTLVNSDKGKKILMNIGAVPKESGINLKQWQYFFESTPFAWFDPKEEGNDYADANNIAKVLDLSLASDIQKYIEYAENIRLQAGRAVGIPDQVEGQIKNYETASNAKQALNQSSMILESYFELHNIMKRNVLQGMLEAIKVAYSGKEKVKLSYALDDLSIETFDLDPMILDNETLDIFINNTSEVSEIKDTIVQLSHAAMQNQTVEFSDIISVIKSKDIVEAEEILKVAENNRRDFNERLEKEKIQAQSEEAEKAREFQREVWANEKENIILKEEEKRKTVALQGALTGMSFNPDTDNDRDGVNDFLEIAKHGLDAEIVQRKMDLEEKNFEHKKENDREKIDLAKEKLKVDKAKAKQKSTKV